MKMMGYHVESTGSGVQATRQVCYGGEDRGSRLDGRVVE